MNFLIGEDELPQGTSKGANTTLNLVYQALQIFAKNGKKKLHITCDNCSGQNKNNLSLWFWTWIIMLGWYEEITVNFMIPGHTKFICDSYFGRIKKTYRDHNVNTIDDIEKIINKSSKSNIRLKYNNGVGWNWYDFQGFFSQNFVNCSHITDYYHFHFSNLPQDLGKVYCSKKSDGDEVCYKLLHNNDFKQLDILKITFISNERRKYLYTKIRKYVENPYKDVYCSKP